MERLAVDIVLIPDTHLFDLVLAVNACLVKDCGSEIVLHRCDCLPHISLVMGCIERQDIPQIKQLMQSFWRDYCPRQLQTRGIVYKTNARGQTISSIELIKDTSLHELHEKVMDAFAPFCKYEATPEMFVGQGPIAESTLAWVNTFQEKSAYENYWPHITLGYGRVDEVEECENFYADSLMLCQLGNHCTCQKVLVKV